MTARFAGPPGIRERQLPDGRWLTLYPLLFGAGRLAVGGEAPDDPEPRGFNDAYDYERLEDAEQAYTEWDGTEEPAGWYRHRPSNRRRPEGDPAREEIRP